MSQAPRGFVLLPGEGESPAITNPTVIFKLVSADSGGSHAVIEMFVPAGVPDPRGPLPSRDPVRIRVDAVSPVTHFTPIIRSEFIFNV
jgi:hypothetical protein